MIKAENIFKSYKGGKVEVLKDLSLEIQEGEFAVILGASGSGKSTLLSVLSGLEKCDKGRVFYGEKEITAMDEKGLTLFRRENVGFIFQQYYLLSHLSVENNVKMGANLSKNQDYLKIIEGVGLADKLKSKPGELSGGEQQRVCIARALAKKPKVLFADEPTGALDEATGRSILDFLVRLKGEFGYTLVMVTHNPNVAQMADKVVYMNSGKIVEVKLNSSKKSAYEIGW